MPFVDLKKNVMSFVSFKNRFQTTPKPLINHTELCKREKEEGEEEKKEVERKPAVSRQRVRDHHRRRIIFEIARMKLLLKNREGSRRPFNTKKKDSPVHKNDPGFRFLRFRFSLFFLYFLLFSVKIASFNPLASVKFRARLMEIIVMAVREREATKPEIKIEPK